MGNLNTSQKKKKMKKFEAEYSGENDDNYVCEDETSSPLTPNGVQKPDTQYVEHVQSFSSEYGSGSAYSMKNLMGYPSNYPAYGDFTAACVFRTYGTFWKECPSASPQVKRQPNTPVDSDDFVDLLFDHPVYPKYLRLYEVYNPGSVIRISAANFTPTSEAVEPKRWVTLWSGDAHRADFKSRTEELTLDSCPYPTQFLRLEYIHDPLHYYYEAEAAELIGELPNAKKTEAKKSGKDQMGDLAKDLENLEILTKDSDEDLNNSFQQLALNRNKSVDKNQALFDALPEELIMHILSFMHIADISNLALVNRLMWRICYDPSFFTSLNLRFTWKQLDDRILEGLAQTGRLSRTEELDLSWCGCYNLITDVGWTVLSTGLTSKIRVLRLASCGSLTSEAVGVLLANRTLLEDLDLSMTGCSLLPEHFTSLTKLKRLNLYRTEIDSSTIENIIKSNPDLEHLNLGGVHSMDGRKVLNALGSHSKILISLDLWRCPNLTNTDLRNFAKGCPMLEEIDLGWCYSNDDLIRGTAQCWPNLKKVFLTACRSTTAESLGELAKNCRNLQQLDLLGCGNVNEDATLEVLRACGDLHLLDISFCTTIPEDIIEQWRHNFPHVDIKRSKTSE